MHPDPRAPIQILLALVAFGSILFVLRVIQTLRKAWSRISARQRVLAGLSVAVNLLLTVSVWIALDRGYGGLSRTGLIGIGYLWFATVLVMKWAIAPELDHSRFQSRAQIGFNALIFACCGASWLLIAPAQKHLDIQAVLGLYILCIALPILVASHRARAWMQRAARRFKPAGNEGMTTILENRRLVIAARISELEAELERLRAEQRDLADHVPATDDLDEDENGAGSPRPACWAQ